MDCMRDGFATRKLLDGGRFETVSPLNHGSFGMVLAARDNLTGQDVAIKCITKPGATVKAGCTATDSHCPAAMAVDDRSEELAIHSRLTNHANIVNLLHHFETDNHQYMVLELCNNGDLYEAIRQGKGPLETSHVRDFMLELVDAIDYLHSNGVFHRDIKPENIFLTSNGAMKLGDFGLATTDTWSTEFAVGSDRYMAPEQFDASVYGYGYSPAAADIWAIGIVLLNVLFQRNPFATPTLNDPLFDDFARDRQSLFDVFPNMSQDTYNVLVHSLALDPANRSLAAVRDALNAVVSFTVDDETLDDFCTEQGDLVPGATAAREPLRTPSITSPNLSTNDAFPWSTVITNALLKSPPKAGRQLSTIQDEDMDLFPGSGQATWQYSDADGASLTSNHDSGLGMSYKSTESAQPIQSPTAVAPRKKATFVGSLPISFSRPFNKSSPYGSSGFSKSWSDLWDEEEEMQEEINPMEDLGMDIERGGTAKPSTPRLNSIRDDGRGSVTPRQGLTDLDANARTAPPSKAISLLERPALPKTRSSSILDKWAALGNFRRAKQESSPAGTPTPPKTKYSEAFASFTPFSSTKRQKAQVTTARERAPSWRQSSPQRLRALSTNGSKIWQEDNNWREHKPPARKTSSPSPPLPTLRQSPSAYKHRYPEKSFLDSDFEEVEWVGGWRDFHL